MTLPAPFRCLMGGEETTLSLDADGLDVAGRRIAWDFAFPDNSVQLYTDHHISPDGPLLKIAHGGYTLTPLADGRVRVTLSSTYRMRSRLGWYLQLWGEQMLGDVHDNVLAIIRQRAER